MGLLVSGRLVNTGACESRGVNELLGVEPSAVMCHARAPHKSNLGREDRLLDSR